MTSSPPGPAGPEPEPSPEPEPAGRRTRPAGVVVVVAVVLLLGAVVVAVVASRAEGGMTDVFELAVGDCVNGVSGTTREAEEFTSTPVVACSEPHEAEVIASFRLEQGRYPGEEVVVAQAQERCADLIVAQLPSAPRPGELLPFYFYPTDESWEHADDRTVHCLAMPARGRTTGSLLDP